MSPGCSAPPLVIPGLDPGIGITALCIGAVHSPSHDVLRLATTTLLVFHAASAIADAMALAVGQASLFGIAWTEQNEAAQAWSLPIALNLALRILMVVLLAAFGLRRAPHAPE